MSKQLTAVALVSLLALEGIKYQGVALEAGKVYEFDPETAERLVAKGAAIVPPAPPQLGATTKVVEKVVEREVVKEVEKVVEVKALSDAGAEFAKLKDATEAVAFVAKQTDAAAIAELQALEFRRKGGPRAPVLEAVSAAFAALPPVTG